MRRQHSHKILILLRHCHRDLSLGRERDNGLSKKGKIQREQFTKFFIKTYLPNLGFKNLLLFSSPRVRCQESLVELSLYLNKEIELSDLLMESSQHDLLEERVKLFHDFYENLPKGSVSVACSHGDWIPIFLKKYLKLNYELKKGAWAECAQKDEDSPLRLLSIIQNFDFIG